jgi:hypothetical protein
VNTNRTEEVERRLFELLKRAGATDYGVVCKRLGITPYDARQLVYGMRKRGIRIDSYFAIGATGEYIPRRRVPAPIAPHQFKRAK